ncbi:MAG TPA: PIG-L deacetylase family protein [Planctomycetota bacterium]|nr:PIG-L deacetylase family protein [Planctomycetota bacterium]
MPKAPAFWTDVPHGRVLVFAPHPDDEVAGPGGVLALHRRGGDPVRVVVTTDGTTGDPDGRYAPAAYAELRRDESRAGLREVAVDDVCFWGFADSCELSEADLERGVQLAVEELARWQPDVVYLPWALEGHPDHHALHVVVTRAIDRAQWRGLALGYEVWNAMVPDVVVDVTSVMDQKRRAMLAHGSQIAYVTYEHCLAGLNAYRSLVHQRGRGYAEAFQLVRGPLPAGPSDADAT